MLWTSIKGIHIITRILKVKSSFKARESDKKGQAMLHPCVDDKSRNIINIQCQPHAGNWLWAA